MEEVFRIREIFLHKCKPMSSEETKPHKNHKIFMTTCDIEAIGQLINWCDHAAYRGLLPELW